MIIICPICGQVRSDDPKELTLYQFLKDKSQLDIVYDLCFSCDQEYNTYLGKNGYSLYKVFPGYAKEWRKIIRSFSKRYKRNIADTIMILSNNEIGKGRLSKFLSDCISMSRRKLLLPNKKFSENTLLYNLYDVVKI